MSMISAQIDELRKWADLYDGTTKPEMAKELQRPYLAQELRDAADTITELRGALQVASVDYRHLEAENAKLQDENARLRSCLSDDADNARQIMGENAKLRELCKDMMAFVEDDDACKRCGHDAECVEAADGELVLPYEGRCLMLDLFADRMRELGVEVEG